ncbi:hypothetical protein Nepgr_019535 [Nepenthes gracilis]|uniref:Uncharacterized protein n=1 Tax=Nepenthes gracilis TaxID=150966 RepID=A0AAD3SVF9_NEPGR|nr:hypothetical protein Nepgr_019535 [Nepenthes gracilis]
MGGQSFVPPVKAPLEQEIVGQPTGEQVGEGQDILNEEMLSTPLPELAQTQIEPAVIPVNMGGNARVTRVARLSLELRTRLKSEVVGPALNSRSLEGIELSQHIALLVDPHYPVNFFDEKNKGA